MLVAYAVRRPPRTARPQKKSITFAQRLASGDPGASSGNGGLVNATCRIFVSATMATTIAASFTQKSQFRNSDTVARDVRISPVIAFSQKPAMIIGISFLSGFSGSSGTMPRTRSAMTPLRPTRNAMPKVCSASIVE